MTVLTATPDLKATFQKLIETMEVQVNWNGLFVVIDNCLILQGDVRSLFFHFDSRKVVTNLIDLDIPVTSIRMIENNEYIKNVINMLLYAFGKWGNIKGLKVEKDYSQLNQLFKNILGELNVEAEYTREHFWFYQKGIRIVYEDVVQCAMEREEKAPELPEEESQGLWHKLVWKQTYEGFEVKETTVGERERNRLGNNFYLTGYLCPECNEKLHSVVYPVGKEFIIDTNEGQVRLARAYTCNQCCSFYTPRPGRLLIDGECYLMDFMGDRVAYEDYQALIGKKGDKVSNYNYNEYVNRWQKPVAASVRKVREPLELPELKLVMAELEELSEKDFEEFFAQAAEGFYPDEILDEVEDALWREYEVRKEEKKAGKKRERKKKIADILIENPESLRSKKIRNEQNGIEEDDVEANEIVENPIKENTFREEELNSAQEKAVTEKIERYEKRLELFPRLSVRQRNELVKQIQSDKSLPDERRKELLESAEIRKKQDNYEHLQEKIVSSKNKNKLVMFRVYEEIQKAELDELQRENLFKKTGITPELYEEYVRENEEAASVERGVKSDTVNGTDTMDKVADEIKADNQRSSEIGTGRKILYVEPLKSGNERKLFGKLENADEPDAIAGSQENIRQRREASPTQPAPKDIRIIHKRLTGVRANQRDELQDILDGILGNLISLPFEDGLEAYEKIQSANLLPELKSDALKQLQRRLAKIKSDECELLVQKLKKELAEAGIAESEKQHFYPARRVLMEEATAEETEVIDYARASYGAGIGPFEYPIYLADTSRNKSGDKGMFLTPEHIFYSNLMTSYHISVFRIESVEAATGLLNKGLYAYLKNGEKIKLPYVVETEELVRFAEVLDGFVKYLQEKPFSRKETYLAKGSHEKICCFRCGHIYTVPGACPKCGYGANQ